MTKLKDRFLPVVRRIKRIVLILGLGLLCFITVTTALHMGLHVCPFHFARFARSNVIPVVYGLPTSEALEEAKRGEIVLGGCEVGFIGGVCSYCKWPVRLSEWIDERSGVPLDGKTLIKLSPKERMDVAIHAMQIINQTQPDMEERITAVLVTQTDVWLGMLESGLHRFDRMTKSWRAYKGGVIGYCIKRIWQDGSRIYVEHDTIGNHRFFYVDFTDDRGKTWTRF